MSFRITVTQIAPAPIAQNADGTKMTESEIYRQTVEQFDLAKFVVALNKSPRRRKTKGTSEK